MNWYVKHKNPNHPLTENGKQWAIDGPFESKLDANNHAGRCDYATRKIQFEVYSDEVVDKSVNEVKPTSRKKGNTL